MPTQNWPGTVSSPTGIGIGGSVSGVGGIAFPAIQVAVADVNTLDDYEEGNWTAAYVCGTSGTITISASTGHYTKNGRQVIVNGYFDVSAIDAPVGSLTITGLPFTIADITNQFPAISIRADGLAATAVTSLQGRGQKNTANILVQKFSAGAAAALAADITTGTDIQISLAYNAAT